MDTTSKIEGAAAGQVLDLLRQFHADALADTAERRAARLGEGEIVPRPCDLHAIAASMLGKLETLPVLGLTLLVTALSTATMIASRGRKHVEV